MPPFKILVLCLCAYIYIHCKLQCSNINNAANSDVTYIHNVNLFLSQWNVLDIYIYIHVLKFMINIV